MKKLIGCLSLVFLSVGTFAQEKQTVHSIIVEGHEIDWYKTQEKLWKAEIDQDSQNGEAWMNYYGAVRVLRILSEANSPEQKKYIEQCNKIATDVYAVMPNTFEGNYIMYWNGKLGQNDEKYLIKAFEFRPEDPRVLLDYLIKSELERDKVTFSKVAKKLYEINRMPAGALNWAYNVLTEVSENGIVFTAGDNDTYALWIVQEAMNYRKDVTVINTYMIQVDDYRAKLFKEKGLAPLEMDKKNPGSTAFFKQIFENNAKIPVHVSTSASGQFTNTTITDNLYLTGLTYIYSLEDVENIAVIKRNFEKRFLLDHLTKTFSYSYGDLDARIKQMYLPGLMKLYMHSKTADDLEGIAYYKGLIDSIGKELGVEAEIQKALAE
ncbi:MAG: hypothetical protein RLZ33_1056 [Bacteroidota bacterium]|jgi:hypothetical protein